MVRTFSALKLFCYFAKSSFGLVLPGAGGWWLGSGWEKLPPEGLSECSGSLDLAAFVPLDGWACWPSWLDSARPNIFVSQPVGLCTHLLSQPVGLCGGLNSGRLFCRHVVSTFTLGRCLATDWCTGICILSGTDGLSPSRRLGAFPCRFHVPVAFVGFPCRFLVPASKVCDNTCFSGWGLVFVLRFNTWTLSSQDAVLGRRGGAHDPLRG